MYKLLPYLAIVLAIFTACSSVKEVVPNEEETSTTFKFDGTEWSLTDCPAAPYLVLHGMPECDFFSGLKWISETDVTISHETNPDPTTYHICETEGSKMSVSIQECANLTWRSLFEFDIIIVNSNTLVFNLEAENLAPGYSERMEFQRVN